MVLKIVLCSKKNKKNKENKFGFQKKKIILKNKKKILNSNNKNRKMMLFEFLKIVRNSFEKHKSNSLNFHSLLKTVF